MNRKNPREISPVEVYFDLIGGKYKATITCPLKKEQDKKIILIKIKKRRRYRPAFFYLETHLNSL